MKTTYTSQVIEGHDGHPLRRIEVRWYDDGTAKFIVRSGQGPILVNPVGTGNYRQASLSISRRPPMRGRPR